MLTILTWYLMEMLSKLPSDQGFELSAMKGADGEQ